jgi:hypothetical protein
LWPPAFSFSETYLVDKIPAAALFSRAFQGAWIAESECPAYDLAKRTHPAVPANILKRNLLCSPENGRQPDLPDLAF